MNAPGSSVDASAEVDDRVAVLERRLERERRARLEAEGIAERGLHRLYLANAELDERVAERTEQLRLAQERAERASEAKSRFLANLSHELRTPLNGIVGMLDLIAGVGNGQVRLDYLSSAQRSAETLTGLIDQLFELIELDAPDGERTISSIAVGALADEVSDRWSRRAMVAGLLLTTDIETGSSLTPDMGSGSGHLSVDIDVDRVAQVIDRLVDNAITHTDGGTVTIRFIPDPDRSSGPTTGEAVGLRVEVIDEGPGLDAVTAEGLFEAFTTGDDQTTRTAGGMGLGLAFARGAVEAMGGRIGLHTDPAIGTVAWFQI